MSLNISSSSDSTSSSIFLNRVKFSIFLTFQICSLSCSLYLFSQYATRQNLRQSIYNHITIVLLYINFFFVAIPLSISEAFFFTSHVRPESDLFCAFWTWIHYSADISNLFLMAFACAERHWLLFCFNPLQTQRRRILYLYIPIILCIIYPWLFYFVFIFLYPCEPSYDYTQLLCLIPCYFFSNIVANIDTFTNNWLPIVAIPILCGTLLIRFLLQKRRVQVEIFRWKRDRRMIIQLLSTASLYFLMWAPLQAATVYDNIVLNGATLPFVVDYLYILPYFVHLLYPFVILCSNSEFQCKKGVVVPQEQHQLQRINRGHAN
jgi:hypothetical protein